MGWLSIIWWLQYFRKDTMSKWLVLRFTRRRDDNNIRGNRQHSILLKKNNNQIIHKFSFQWDLVCDDAYKTSLATTIYFVGVMLGGLVFGTLSDRFGRRPVFLFTMFSTFVIGLPLFFIKNYIAFVVLRFFLGFVLQVRWVIFMIIHVKANIKTVISSLTRLWLVIFMIIHVKANIKTIISSLTRLWLVIFMIIHVKANIKTIISLLTRLWLFNWCSLILGRDYRCQHSQI